MPAPGRSASGGRRQGLVENLMVHAQAKPVNNTLSLAFYYNAADLMLKQMGEYRKIHNDSQLYVLLLRHASLIIETVPRHKMFSKAEPRYLYHKQLISETLLEEAAHLKAALRFQDLADLELQSTNRPANAVQLTTSDLKQINWTALDVPDGPAPPAFSPLDAQVPGFPNSSYSTTLLELPSVPPQPRTSYGSAPQLPPAAPYSSTYQASSQHSLSKHALYGSRQQTQRQPTQPSANQQARYPRFDTTPASVDLADLLGPPATPALPPPHQPTAPSLPGVDQLSLMDAPAYAHPSPSAGPSLGPQEVQVMGVDPSSMPPGQSCSSAPQPPGADTCTALAAPGGARELRKRTTLRDVHISVALMEDFLHFANANTRRGIESCGILSGTLSANDSSFHVNMLIVPKQQGTSDTVQALNEEEIFETQFSRELYPMGWIHTHPSQTCFLSSVDVHTQLGYQVQLEEAVAIVMAPSDSKRRCGLFRLTTPGGLSTIQRCDLRGFHPHPPTETGQDIYEICGHVYLTPDVKHQVIDLR